MAGKKIVKCDDEIEFSVCSFEGIYLCGPVAQLVRAPPCHGGGRGFESLLGRLHENAFYKVRDLSSAGRASALQAEGHRFEPCRSHLYGWIAQLARAHGSYPWCREFKSLSSH